MINVVLLGPPGAGKGTQSKVLQEKYGLKQLSTGEMLRAEVAAGTPIGREVKDILEQGGLVSDETMVEMLIERMKQPDCKNGVIFDGFPRTVPQARALDVMLWRVGLKLTAVIQITVDEGILMDRIRKRDAEAGVSRADDTPEVLIKRLEAYHAKTAPIIPYYQEDRRLKQVDGMQPIEVVSAQIDEIIRQSK